MTDHNETHEDYEKLMADMRDGFALELASKSARIAELDAALTEAVGLFTAQKEMYERSQGRVAELEIELAAVTRQRDETWKTLARERNEWAAHRQKYFGL